MEKSGLTVDGVDGVEINDLPALAEAFDVGDVLGMTFLPSGIMNRNWRLDTTTGTFALKQLRDVPAERASRSAAVLVGLQASAVPVCAPVMTVDGEMLFRVDSREYLLSEWAEGSHREGTDLSLAETEEFGVVVARIHDALAEQAGSVLPPTGARPQATVTTPQVRRRKRTACWP